MKPYDHEGISWFDQVYPKFKQRSGNSQMTLGEQWGMVEVLQKPGETIFVPGGWPHVVMNLDMTVAVTQNFCSSTNAEYVYLSTRHSRPKLGQKLYREIQKLGRNDPKTYASVAKALEMTQFIPQLPPSDSSSGSGSTSTSSSSSSGSDSGIENNVPTTPSSKKRKIVVSSTDSETDLSDGTCMCKKCKFKRKKKARKDVK
jgi:histone arginine demethylase JMJD6